MPPCHRLKPRLFVVRAMLIKNVVIPLKINKSVRVVDPAFFGLIVML
jgi:hypothetical protein